MAESDPPWIQAAMSLQTAAALLRSVRNAGSSRKLPGGTASDYLRSEER
jgi:hypothetical protein